MAIVSAMASTYKRELFEGRHNHLLTGGNTFLIALIKATPTGSYGAASTNYSDITGNTDEVANGNGYTTGGATLTRVDPALDGTTAYTNFGSPVTWSTASFSADGCMIYNNTNGNRAVSVHDFGGTKTASGGDFTVTMPANAVGTALLRLA